MMSRRTMRLAMRGETGTMRRGYQLNYLGKDEWGKSVGIQVVRVSRPNGTVIAPGEALERRMR